MEFVEQRTRQTVNDSCLFCNCNPNKMMVTDNLNSIGGTKMELIEKVKERLRAPISETDIWVILNELFHSPGIYCKSEQGLTPTLIGQSLYLLATTDECVFVYIDRAVAHSDKFELEDEEMFSGECPLWFTECSHRVSPVFNLRVAMSAFMEANRKATGQDVRVWGILLTTSHLINYEDYAQWHEQASVSVIQDMQFNGQPLECSEHVEEPGYILVENYWNVLHNNEIDFKQIEMAVGNSIPAGEIYMDKDTLTEMESERDLCTEDEEFEEATESLDDFIQEVRKNNPAFLEQQTATMPDGTSVQVNMESSMPQCEILPPLRNPQKALDELVGLTTVKNKMNEFYFLAQYNQLLKRQFPDAMPHKLSLHAVFSGNPGTGKTTLARIWASMLHSLGLLSKGHTVFATRASLIGTKWGQEEENLTKLLALAEGGVLFIDEAYSLQSANTNDPGRLILPLLLTTLADERKRDLSVVLAGYPKPMGQLLETNPGILSRFPLQFQLENFSIGQLMEIAKGKIRPHRYHFTRTAWKALHDSVEKAYKQSDQRTFGNGRFIANLLQRIYTQHAMRVMRQNIHDERMFTITFRDIEAINDTVLTLKKEHIGFR